MSAGEWVLRLAEQYFDGPDVIDPRHIREGVVIRILNRPKFEVYKHKNFFFKVLSGIAIEAAEASGAVEKMDSDIIEEM